MYKSIIRPILFKFDPEVVHYFTFDAIKLLSKIPGIPFLTRRLFQLKHPVLERELFGLRFKNPVGLAAGFDKNAVLYTSLQTLGLDLLKLELSLQNHKTGILKNVYLDFKRIVELSTEWALIMPV